MSQNRRTHPETTAEVTLARHRVRDGIQELILAGRYRSGQRLTQQELARRFGVAQSVVRESLLELQFCGLVEAVDHVGVFVSGADPQTLLQAYAIREVFEGLSARLCCQHASRSEVGELKEMARRIFDLGRQGELEAMSALDRQFHFRTILISDNRLLAKLTEGYRLLGMFVRADRDVRQVRDEHLEIVRAIEENEPDRAERLAREHVRAAGQSIRRQVDEGTFVPHWVGDTGQDQPLENITPADPPTSAESKTQSRRKQSS